uniref:Reverse transcriptase domain-containing protein n=1 Tax=Lactuca sativa TaxID=4236 RepID=A0A9R1VB74_LACSA|nr:hypothetical protein LSAT_V11C500229270 [Lactuca sativa]
MDSSFTSSSDICLYSFRTFHCCPNVEVGSKGTDSRIAHIIRNHQPTKDCKCVLHEALSSDIGLFMEVEETLKAFGQWMCGKYMDLHALSRYCHHPDGRVRFVTGADGSSRYIFGILKSPTKASVKNARGGLVFDVGLLDRVFKAPITIVKNNPKVGAMGQGGGILQKESTSSNTNIRQCLRKVADGQFTSAVKVLCSSGVAPYNGTSCGRDGLRAQHLLDALCGEGSAIATDLIRAITSVVNLWLAGRCPTILAEFVAPDPLTPLLKPDNGIRPIEGGTILRRLVSKVSMKGVDANSIVVGVYSSGANSVVTKVHLTSANSIVAKVYLTSANSIVAKVYSACANSIVAKVHQIGTKSHRRQEDDRTALRLVEVVFFGRSGRSSQKPDSSRAELRLGNFTSRDLRGLGTCIGARE